MELRRLARRHDIDIREVSFEVAPTAESDDTS
jgi:hypothetical protein